jgi:hypothetical protein
VTLKELSQLFWLNREIEEDKKRLAELEAKVGGLASPSLSGMPHGGDNSSKVEREAVEVVTMYELIENKKKRCELERVRLLSYIDTIPDSLTRQIFTLRFVDGLCWEQVAASLGGNTVDSVKKTCYRYIKQSNASGEEVAE